MSSASTSIYKDIQTITGGDIYIGVVGPVRTGKSTFIKRFMEEMVLPNIEDEDAREALPVIGYVGYYRLINGAEKTVYMSVKAITAHEKKFSKGDYQGKGWRDDWDALARKTVYRILIGKWGVMSIDYQTRDAGIQLADVIAADAHEEETIDANYTVDETTGEVIESDGDAQ